MKTLDELLRDAMKAEGSDVFIIPFSPVSTKSHGKMVRISEEKVTLPEIQVLIDRAYELAGRNKHNLERDGDDDFSFAIRDVSRFRCNVFRPAGSRAAAYSRPGDEAGGSAQRHGSGDGAGGHRQKHHHGLYPGSD